MSPYTEKSFYLEHLGCAKNRVDAEIIIQALIEAGLFEVSNPEDADLIIINSCAFIAPAKEETIDVTLSIRKNHPKAKIVLAGCFPQRYGAETLDLLPEVDAIFGNLDPSEIIKILDSDNEKGLSQYFPENPIRSYRRTQHTSFPGSTYIKISEGCRHNCAFCAIPLIRGKLRSRDLDDIVDEVREALAAGFLEFNFIAQDLASFGYDRGKREFCDLIKTICELPDRFWLRLLYIHPDNFPPEIMDICAADDRILPYFDLPFQHASAKILSSMGRKGNSEAYLRLVDDIRRSLPDSVIRTSLMVGYPGETNDDFKRLLDFQQAAQFDWAGVFQYSREEGTRAYPLSGFPGSAILKRKSVKRKEILEQKQTEISSNRLKRYIGQKISVIIEEPVENSSLYIGRGYFQAPEVDGLVVVTGENLTPGKFIDVKIVSISGIDCKGEVVG